MKELKNRPEVRFKGFDEEWFPKIIGEIFKVTRGNVLSANLTKDKKSHEAPYPVYSSQTKNDGLLGYYKDYLFENAITWTTDGANAGTVNYRHGRFYSTNVNGVLLSDTGFANKAVAESLNMIAWRYVSKVGNPKLMNNVMSEITLTLPNSIPELTKLSGLLSEIDSLITQHQQKQNKLLAFKKAMLEKMFPKTGADVPEIRFKGFDGEWEEKKLGDLMEITSASRVHKNEWKDNGVPFFRSSDVIAAYKGTNNNKAFISFELFHELAGISGYVKKNDILVTGGGSIGIPYLVKSDEPLYFKDGDLIWLKSTLMINSYFIYTFFSTKNFRDYVNSITHIGTISHYTIVQAKETPLSFPSLEEQLLIGSFFQQLEELISSQKTQIEKLHNLKQALLNKMFV